MRRTAIVTALLAAHVVVLAPSAPGSSPAAAPDRGVIVFSASPGGLGLAPAPDIYMVKPDGSGLTRLTESPSPDRTPSFSPNGALIAFERDGDIFVMEATGENERNVTETPDVEEREPDWSPDGTLLAFRMTVENEPVVSTMDVDGSKVRRLDFGGDPSWSPDGRRIAFDTALGDGMEDWVKVMSSTGGPARIFRKDFYDDEEPAWSPNGRRLAYVHDEAIAIAPIDGSKARVYFWDRGVHTSPSWAPGGRALAFVRKGALYTFRPSDGVEHEVETTIGLSVIDADWGPCSGSAPSCSV